MFHTHNGRSKKINIQANNIKITPAHYYLTLDKLNI